MASKKTREEIFYTRTEAIRELMRLLERDNPPAMKGSIAAIVVGMDDNDLKTNLNKHGIECVEVY